MNRQLLLFSSTVFVSLFSDACKLEKRIALSCISEIAIPIKEWVNLFNTMHFATNLSDTISREMAIEKVKPLQELLHLWPIIKWKREIQKIN